MVAGVGNPNNLFTLAAITRGFNQAGLQAGQLSSGQINPATNPGQFLNGLQLLSESSNLSAVTNNISLAQGFLRSAEGGLQSILDLNERASQLAIRASDGALSNNDRELLDVEFQNVLDEINRISADTEFTGRDPIAGSGTTDTDFRTGTGILPGEDTITTTIEGSNTDALGLTGLSIATQTDAETAISALDASVDTIVSNLANVGAGESRLEFAQEFVTQAQATFQEAGASLTNLDIARGISAFQAANQLTQFGIAATGLQLQNQGALASLLA